MWHCSVSTEVAAKLQAILMWKYSTVILMSNQCLKIKGKTAVSFDQSSDSSCINLVKIIVYSICNNRALFTSLFLVKPVTRPFWGLIAKFTIIYTVQHFEGQLSSYIYKAEVKATKLSLNLFKKLNRREHVLLIGLHYASVHKHLVNNIMSLQKRLTSWTIL